MSPLEIAVTVDELLLWDGTPMPRGYTARGNLDGIMAALAEHGLTGIYGFAHTAPVEDRPGDRDVLEAWCSAGHHLGNHTHCHACLNWVGADRYCEDIRVSQELIGELLERAPVRYFRHAMDMSGPSEAGRGAVEDFLREEGYTTAPITAWFGDFAWTAPYARAIDGGDREAADMLRASFVDAAVFQLVKHAEAARRLFGADLPYIWMLHATPIAKDMLGEILQRFVELGVRFVPLGEAMRHPAHRSFPPVSPLFRNHLQRYAIAGGDEVEGPPPELVQQIVGSGAPEGVDPWAVYDEIIRRMAERAGGSAAGWSWA